MANKCNITENDKILFGSGGSTAIIIITKTNRVFKMFPIFYWTNSENIQIQTNIKRQKKGIDEEINIGKQITFHIIDKNISPHFVKYIGYNNCIKASKIFSDCPSYIEMLKSKKDNKKCSMIYRQFPLVKLYDSYKVYEIEYCDYECKAFLQDISTKSIEQMKYYLDIFLFQICYTLVKTNEKYPYFQHGDLFIRNVLGQHETNTGKYYAYTYNNKEYMVPQTLFMPKINDYGLSNLDKKYHLNKLEKNKTYIDFYNLVFDIYNQNDFGAKSLYTLCIKNKRKLEFLDKYFRTFFNVNQYKQLRKTDNGKRAMNWNWHKLLNDELANLLEIVDLSELLNNYFYKIFAYKQQDIISNKFG